MTQLTHANGTHANGTQAMGVRANGSHANGILADPAHATGSQATGVQATGARASGSHGNGIVVNPTHAQGVHSTGTHAQARAGRRPIGLPALFAAIAALIAIAAPRAMAAGDDIESHPGYVDFSSLRAIAGSEPTVEISLKEPLLNMLTNVMRSGDGEVAAFVSKLLRVSVNVFEGETLNGEEVAASMTTIAADLDAQGWERVVRVREDDEHVNIHFRLSEGGDLIHGIAIMVAEPDETVLVNIVGDISEQDIMALGRHFNISELVDMDMDGAAPHASEGEGEAEAEASEPAEMADDAP